MVTEIIEGDFKMKRELIEEAIKLLEEQKPINERKLLKSKYMNRYYQRKLLGVRGNAYSKLAGMAQKDIEDVKFLQKEVDDQIEYWKEMLAELDSQS